MATSQTRVRARPPTKAAIVPGRSLRLIVSTCPARSAARLARGLVDARLAACVNVVPGVRSTYRWKGRIESARESLLLVKTTAPRVRACLAALAKAHPYEVPEGLAFAPDFALARYAAWLHAFDDSALA